MTDPWTGCYDDSWKEVITPESFSHPAKMSRALLRRILDHAFERGWVSKGSVVCDPFGGIGSTASDVGGSHPVRRDRHQDQGAQELLPAAG